MSHDLGALEGDLLGRFFELFSQKIDPARRRALGQYYTPLPIVRFMWQLVREKGLTGVDPAKVTVIDPGMGSGTFLCAGVDILESQGASNTWQQLVGFDVSPTVMGIAQVNLYIALLRHLTREDAKQIGELRLYTTDALDPRNGKYLRDLLPLFDDPEHREFLQQTIEVSSAIKRDERFCIVIGNPPYRNNASLTLAQVADRFPGLLASSAAAARAQARNIRDDYAWFFAAADSYAAAGGVVCFITSDSYTRKASYALFREEILKRYVVHKLVRLGVRIFQDVSPRISFAVILLKRRVQPLDSADQVEPIPFVDLSDLARDCASELLATESDPRLRVLQEVAENRGRLPEPVMHQPQARHGYSLLPVSEDIVGSVLRDSAPIYSKTHDHLFKRKWPGVITAFDVLFKGSTKGKLQEKVESLFALCHTSRGSVRKLASSLDKWAERYRLTDEQRTRLEILAIQIEQSGLAFDRSRLKLSVSGSIPNDLRWYPPPQYRHWLYYEEHLHVPRNVHPGKSKGWGSMEQWRDPLSHAVTPKLIFTSTQNPKSGYKAFVVDDEWYAKLHGGTSQQYNYTVLSDPSSPEDIHGGPNNLTTLGLHVAAVLASAGHPSEDLFHLIAGIYNSAMAAVFLEEESEHELAVRLPTQESRSIWHELIVEARQLRDLHRLLYDLPEAESVSAKTLASLCSRDVLSELQWSSQESGGRRTKAASQFRIPGGWKADVEERIEEGQSRIDDLVEAYFA